MIKENQNKSPFKFLDSYSESDGDIFFGREKETEELYAKVFQGKLLLVYGASGSGKSSVINCGLANKFDVTDWLPINIRRGGNILQSTFNQIGRWSVAKPSSSHSNENLRKLLGSVFLDHFKPIYLIFDQFEELFIFGYEDEWKEFIAAVKYIMDTDLDVHFIFVIRGEYLEFLSAFEDLIPDFFDNRLRIEKMTRKNAIESIKGPAKEFNIQLDDGFEENLIRKINPDKAHVELTFLQVFLDRIYRNAISDQPGNDSLLLKNEQIDQIGQISDVLAEFVDEQLFRMPNPKAALTVLKTFVSLQGTKTQMTIEQVIQSTVDLGYPISHREAEGIIRELVNKRILKEQDENEQFELRHDSLAQKIYEKITHQERELLDVRQLLAYSLVEYQKRGTLLTDDNLIHISPFLRLLKLESDLMEFIEISKKNSTRRRKSRRTRSIIGVIILLLTVTSIIGFAYSQVQKNRAEELAQLAQKESAEALKQRAAAEQERLNALRSEAKAREQAQLALEASTVAAKQRKEAVKQRQIAESQRIDADLARSASEESELSALEQKRIAQEQYRIAENQKKIALNLRAQALAINIANKSLYAASKELKGLLSLQALRLNLTSNGDTYEPRVYRAIYEARKTFFHDFNTVYAHSAAIAELSHMTSDTYVLAKDGNLISLSNKETTPLPSTYIYTCMAILDQSKIALGTKEGVLLIVDRQTGSILTEQVIHQSQITKIIVDKTEIVSADADGTIGVTNFSGAPMSQLSIGGTIKDLSTGEDEIWVLSGHNEISIIKGSEILKNFELDTEFETTQIQYDHQTSLLFIGSMEGKLLVWNTNTNHLDQVLVGHSAAITDIQVSQKGTFLASASLDRSVRIWPKTKGFTQPIVLKDHDNWVSSIAFSDDEKILYSATYSGTVKSFDLDVQKVAAGLCEKIGRNLTVAEWNEYIDKEMSYQSICDE